MEIHFFFKALQEVNELLTKNNQGFLLDYSSNFHYIFRHQLLFYCELKGYCIDGVLNTKQFLFFRSNN